MNFAISSRDLSTADRVVIIVLLSSSNIVKHIEDITWPRGDMKFLFEC